MPYMTQLVPWRPRTRFRRTVEGIGYLGQELIDINVEVTLTKKTVVTPEVPAPAVALVPAPIPVEPEIMPIEPIPSPTPPVATEPTRPPSRISLTITDPSKSHGTLVIDVKDREGRPVPSTTIYVTLPD